MADLTLRIHILCDAYVVKLNDLHDDFVHTRMLWVTLQVRVRRYSENPRVTNPITGNAIEGVALAGKASGSLDRLRNRSFKDIVVQLELFTAELLRAWLFESPLLMSEKALNIATLLKSKSLVDAQQAAIREAVDSTLTDKMYGRPDKWFNYLRKNLGVKFDAQDEAAYVEMKARRDVLEHQSGIVEATYLEKAKAFARYRIGDQVKLANRDIDEAYRLILALVRKSTTDAIAKSMSSS